MTIDKTTGKGCALSIASKAITRKLIDEGITNRVIAKKLYKRYYVWLRVVDSGAGTYVSSQRVGWVPEEPLWVPSFIDPEIWARAVSKFSIRRRLDDNVAQYLFPEMEESLNHISDQELVSVTRDFLLEHGVINQPIQQHRGKTYYFDENEVYSLDETGLFPYEGQLKWNIFKITGPEIVFFNNIVWLKAASRFEVGMTLRECIGIFLKTELIYQSPQEPTPIDQLAQYINRPIYERVPENRNEATFDRIRITVGLPRYRFQS